MVQSRQEFIQNYRHAQGWWEDAVNVKTTATNNLTWNVSYGGWEFTNTSNRFLFANIQMLHAKRLGTNANFHIHWMPTTTGTGTVDWIVDYYWKNSVGDTAQGTFAAATTLTTSATPNGTAYVMQIDGLGTMTAPTSESVSSIISIRLYRDGTNDAYNDNVILKDFDPHVQLDQPGSIAEFGKWGV